MRQLYCSLGPGEEFSDEILPHALVARSLCGKLRYPVNRWSCAWFIASNDDRLPLGCVPELIVDRMREPRWPHAYLLDRQTREQASPGHELPVNEKMLPLTHESNVFPLKMPWG